VAAGADSVEGLVAAEPAQLSRGDEVVEAAGEEVVAEDWAGSKSIAYVSAFTIVMQTPS
jgi:hypothetical protein